MPALFKSLAELLEKVEATKKRLEITDLTANYLKTLNPEEIEPAKPNGSKICTNQPHPR
jgi:hypothetical protein